MAVKKYFIYYLLLIGISLYLMCSNSSIAGGTVIPNAVVGNVVYDNSKPAEGVDVTIKQIIIKEDGDSVVFSKNCVTDEYGKYEFRDVPRGRYVITVADSSDNLYAVNAKFEKNTDSMMVNENLVLRKRVTLVGRIVEPAIMYDEPVALSQVRICLPGITARYKVDSAGIYVIPNVPVGSYDITIIYGNTLNFLPVNVASNSPDTVYVKDVRLETNTGNQFDVYSFYENEFEYSYAVLPKMYRPQNLPDWYIGKDFSYVSYYLVTSSGAFKKYDPKYSALFYVSSSGVWASDLKLQNYMQEELEMSVTVVMDSAASISDTMGMDIIYISSSVHSDTLASHICLHEVNLPIVVSEDNLYPVLGLTDTVEGSDFGDASTDGFIKVVMPSHYIAGNLKDYVQVLYDSGYLGWGIPVSSSKVIATYPGYKNVAVIFAVNKGDILADGGAAPNRRVAFFFAETNYTVRNLTDDGLKLFKNSMLWALGFGE